MYRRVPAAILHDSLAIHTFISLHIQYITLSHSLDVPSNALLLFLVAVIHRTLVRHSTVSLLDLASRSRSSVCLQLRSHLRSIEDERNLLQSLASFGLDDVAVQEEELEKQPNIID